MSVMMMMMMMGEGCGVGVGGDTRKRSGVAVVALTRAIT